MPCSSPKLSRVGARELAWTLAWCGRVSGEVVITQISKGPGQVRGGWMFALSNIPVAPPPTPPAQAEVGGGKRNSGDNVNDKYLV